jgi:surface protein
MSQTPVPFSSSFRSLTLNVTTGTGQNQVTHTQAITSVHEGNNSVPITDSGILNAFNSQPMGTSFTSSIVAEYGNALTTVSTPSVASFMPRIISLADIPNKLSTDDYFNLSSLVTTVSDGVLSYSSSNTDVATIILMPSTLYSIDNPTLYSKLTNFPSISILSDWEINISFVTTISGRYQALISDRSGFNTNGWTIWLNPQGGVHITSYSQGLYLDFLNGSVLPNKNYILTVRRTTNVLYIYVNNVETGNTVSTSYNGNVTFTPDENVYAGFIPGSAYTLTEGFQGTILAINVLSLNLLPSINIVGAGTTTITVSQAATANHRAASASSTFTVSLPPPPISLAANGVTIQYTGAAGDVPTSSARFIEANPRGTGNEWFAVVKDGMKDAITNYANGLSGSSTPFTPPGQSPVLFNNIVTTLMTDMSSMFENAYSFNYNISSWDTSNVTNMNRMFKVAQAFNQSLNYWDVSSVTSMYEMFIGAVAFNQPLNNWDVSSVTNMTAMFAKSSSSAPNMNFNQNISGWVVAQVTSFNNFRISTPSLANINMPQRFLDNGQ